MRSWPTNVGTLSNASLYKQWFDIESHTRAHRHRAPIYGDYTYCCMTQLHYTAYSNVFALWKIPNVYNLINIWSTLDSRDMCWIYNEAYVNE